MQKSDYYGSYVCDVDEIGRLSQFALTDVKVRKVDDDNVLANLRQLLSGPTAVACETLSVRGFSLDVQRFMRQISLVGELLQTIRHVEELE